MFSRGRKASNHTDSLGSWGEAQAERFLKKGGLKTLARNVSCRSGEIDLVMVDAERAVVFVEVKTRACETFAPTEEAIHYGKRQRMIRAARYFLAAHHIEDRPLRFDAVIVLGTPESGHPQVRHYENIFTP